MSRLKLHSKLKGKKEKKKENLLHLQFFLKNKNLEKLRKE